MNTKQRSFLKWAGSKYLIREKIINTLPKGARLIEPFTGSGVIFLNSDYPDYLLAEKNLDLVNLYQLVQKEGPSFITDAKKYFTLQKNTQEVYLKLRARFNALLHKTSPKAIRERALLFIYLNRHGYNGLCRYNSQGEFNVPFGRYAAPKLPEENLHIFYKKSQKAEFIHADFTETLKQAKFGDVIYCDPPYTPLTKQQQAFKYTGSHFSEDSQKRLGQFAHELSIQGISVIISNHDTPETRRYYQKASEIITLEVQRFISCDKEKRHKARELIAIFKP